MFMQDPTRPNIQFSQSKTKNMNEFNGRLNVFIKKYSENTQNLVQQLFYFNSKLTNPDQKKITQRCILAGIEQLHDFATMARYIEQWRDYEFREKFIIRMRRRVDQPYQGQDIPNTKEEVLRLIQISGRNTRKYFFDEGRKKQVEEDEKSFKSASGFSVQNQATKISNAPVSHGVQENSQPQSSVSNLSRKSFSSLTGRPAILKKKIHNTLKQKTIEQKSENGASKVEKSQPIELKQKPKKDEEDVNDNASCKSLPNSRKSTIKFRSEDLNKRKTQETYTNQKNFPKSVIKEEKHSGQNLSKPENEPFPSEDQFQFGSSKKKEPQPLRKMSITPYKKVQFQNKRVVLQRIQPAKNQETKTEDLFEEFSFMEKFEKKSEEEVLNSSEKNSESQHPPIEKEQEDHSPFFEPERPLNNLTSDITPTFLLPRKEEECQFLTEVEMEIVGPRFKPYNYYGELMKQIGIDPKKILMNKLQNIRPKAYNG